MQFNKNNQAIGVILLSEYHASSIRLPASDIADAVIFGICRVVFASRVWEANRISLKPQRFNITIAVAIISLFAKAKNITKKAEKERELHGIL